MGKKRNAGTNQVSLKRSCEGCFRNAENREAAGAVKDVKTDVFSRSTTDCCFLTQEVLPVFLFYSDGAYHAPPLQGGGHKQKYLYFFYYKIIY